MHDIMSDLWPFSSSCPPPTVRPLSSPSLTTNHGNSPHAKVSSHHLMPQTQVSSPHLPEPQVTSPHPLQMVSLHLSHPQDVSSPHIIPETQVSSPHLLYQPQVSSPHCVPWSQASSPHLLPQAQVTSPYLLPQSQVTSPHLLSPPQYHHHDPGFDDLSWSRAEAPSDLSHLLKTSYQNQTTAHLDLHLQNQNQFSPGVTLHRDGLENTHRPPCGAHMLLATGLYEQGDTVGAVQDTWGPPGPPGPPGPTLPQLQFPPLGSLSAEVAPGRWSSMEFSSAVAEDSSSNHFFHDSCHDNNAPQPFCSPNTPGPSPHYPQTPTYSSPGPQIYPREERLDFHPQTSRQLSRDQTLSCCLQEYDSYAAVTSDPGQHQQLLLQSQSEPIQDQTGLLDAAGNSESCFSPQGGDQEVSGATQSAGGGRGRGGRGRGGRGGSGQPDWTWMKRPQIKNNTGPLDNRLSCVVCKRDFRSLPALNGHMRSHSGSRSAAWSNKGEDSSPVAPPSSVSMVMPVTVPVQSRGVAKACRGGQRRCGLPSPAGGRAVLYRSLLHLQEEEEETVAKGDGRASSRGGDDEESAVSGDGVVTGGDGDVSSGHFTPPPMLCPLRVGPGLYCSLLTTRRQQRAQTVQLRNTHNELSDLVATETASPPPPGTPTTGINKPRINVGRSFQAEIPPLRGRKHAHSDSHNALLLWAPWEELERPANQQRVEALVTMARSSVVPGGGASPESALHVLSESRGDFLLTVEKLLSTRQTSNKNRTDRHDTSVSWSAAETKSLLKSLQLHHKDFSRIQKAVQTKSLSQCVEFYYLWKKKLSLSLRTSAGLTVTLPDINGQRWPKIT
ncbi:uncharacterized protein ABDE67_021959 [Symphorus nematophorus]